jgi:hypothetical protein
MDFGRLGWNGVEDVTVQTTDYEGHMYAGWCGLVGGLLEPKQRRSNR